MPRGSCEEAGEPPMTGFSGCLSAMERGRFRGEEQTHFLFVFISQLNSEQGPGWTVPVV